MPGVEVVLSCAVWCVLLTSWTSAAVLPDVASRVVLPADFDEQEALTTLLLQNEEQETRPYNLAANAYSFGDDLMERSRRGRRYTAGELLELLKQLAASRRLREVRVANKGIRFGISKRSVDAVEKQLALEPRTG